jgi:hypothetical protein
MTYPIYLQRSFERRWAARIVRDQPRRSPAQGTDTCDCCGNVVTAPSAVTYSPKGVVNVWRCTVCGNQWNTVAVTDGP